MGHGGTIEVTSAEAGGATFAVRLPRLQAEPGHSGMRQLAWTQLVRQQQWNSTLAPPPPGRHRV